jgi:hypothetical protein
VDPFGLSIEEPETGRTETNVLFGSYSDWRA